MDSVYYLAHRTTQGFVQVKTIAAVEYALIYVIRYRSYATMWSFYIIT